MGKDNVNGVAKSSQKKATKASGDRELKRHANPPLTRGRVQVLEMERLGFWLAHEEYHLGIGVARPGPLLGSPTFVGWSEMEEEEDVAGGAIVSAKKRGRRRRSNGMI